MMRQASYFHLRFVDVRAFHARTLPLLVLMVTLLFTCPIGSVRADDTTRQVQEELRKRNLFFGDVDGCRSPQLVAAVRRYQERKGFSPSGDTDDQTLRSLSLRPPQPLGFSPPAAAATVSNSNPPTPGAGSTSASQDGTMPNWPDITVLRSDNGRSTPSSATLAAALSNIVPGMADAISPPGRFTVVPPVSSSSNQHPTASEARDFIARYLRAGQSNDPDAELAFYGDRVKYFNEGTVDRRFIAQDIRRYEKRWPQRSFTVVGPISVVADANNLDRTLVHFRYQFTNKSSRFTVNGEADNLFTLEGTGPDSLRIIALKERRVR